MRASLALATAHRRCAWWMRADKGPEIGEVCAAGFDVNGGMVLELNERLHYGEDTIRRLALLSSSSNLFNRMTRWVFRFKARTRLL